MIWCLLRHLWMTGGFGWNWRTYVLAVLIFTVLVETARLLVNVK